MSRGLWILMLFCGGLPSVFATGEGSDSLKNRVYVEGFYHSGIFWTLGRYDRPWGPERPIFGKVRFMSSQNTARPSGAACNSGATMRITRSVPSALVAKVLE